MRFCKIICIDFVQDFLCDTFTILHSQISWFMQWIDIIGYIGVVLSCTTFVPQVVHAWRTRSVNDLSIWMIIILLGNVSTWLFYGAYKGDMPIIVANSIILMLALLLLYFKIIFSKGKGE